MNITIPEQIVFGAASIGITAGTAVLLGAPALAGVSVSVISNLFTTAVLACIKEPSDGTQTLVSWLGWGVGLGATIGLFAAIGVTVSVFSLILTSFLSAVIVSALFLSYICCCRPDSCGGSIMQAASAKQSFQT